MKESEKEREEQRKVGCRSDLSISMVLYFTNPKNIIDKITSSGIRAQSRKNRNRFVRCSKDLTKPPKQRM